ncbi:cobalamin biosynthesis protein [Gluconacetobacter johannae]|uniref:Precorrin methylase n=1 Tax=Gluconacetobacter johannae TaxID=112140 RepID=A0A7W4P2J8_9PROT|nr:cobalamin biosynthesis protein [Gluconacetobacter johannae]MBB2174854.1 precorrin methylase [Gluconacetobacter johannae]
MRVAGFGFRQAASLASLRDALAAAGGARGIDALATVAQKAGSPPLLALAAELGLPIRALAAETLAHVATPTRSSRVMAGFGTGSIAEAAALAAAGAGARLLAPRAASADGMAMAAIAEKAEGNNA